MRFQHYINEDNVISSALKKVKSLNSSKSVERFLKDQFKKMSDMLKDDEEAIISIINKAFKTSFKSFDQILKGKVQVLKEESLNEDLAHWWDVVKTEAFPTLAFYPALQIWLEIDKYIKGQDFSTKAMIVYGLFWILLVSGKYVKGWLEWKKQNPDEYKKEREEGKGGIV